MIAKITAFLRVAYGVLTGGAWVSAAAFALSVATTTGILDTGQATELKSAASTLLNVAVGAAAFVHAVHVRRLQVISVPAASGPPAEAVTDVTATTVADLIAPPPSLNPLLVDPPTTDLAVPRVTPPNWAD